MRKQIFVPLTDEMLYEHPECINGPLMPYNRGRPSLHAMAQNLTSPARSTGRGESVFYTFPSSYRAHSIGTQKIA